MSRYWDKEERNAKFGLIIRDVLISSFVLVALLMTGCPHYTVWTQGMRGEAELRRAEQNRQIAVQEAQAKLESAKLLADAEIIRAKGVSEANEIVKKGLGGPEGYLRYLYIQTLEETQNQIIYIPTEAGLPILEAGKRPGAPQE